MINLLLLLAGFVSEIIGTMAGFGSSTIFLPLALFFVDFKTALMLVAIFHIFGNLGRITFFKKGINKRLLLIFGVPSILLTLIGALLVNYIQQELLKMVLGVFLLLYTITFIYNPAIKVATTIRNSIIGGSLSGFFAGLIGTGGALRGAFLNAYNLEKTTYIATAAMIALLVDITRIPIYLKDGFLPQQYYLYIPLLFIIAIVGSFLGKKIVTKIPQEQFKKLVLIGIALISIKFIIEGITYLLS